MSGFGLRNLKKKSENDEREQKRSYIKHLVYGENLAAVLTFQKLFDAEPGQVKIMTQNPYYFDEINHDLDCSMQTIRDEDVANTLIGMYPQLEIHKRNENVLFYKDTKLHKFGGRAKSHNLKGEEEYYISPYFHAKPNNLFHISDEVLKQFELNKIIQHVELSAPSDLLEKVNFRLKTGDNEVIDCEYLYFCESPKKFFSLIADKSELPDSLAKFIAPLKNYRAITVHYECAGQVHEGESSMIIPQSMTHEWGSFVLDFEAYDPAANQQNFTALSFLDEDLVQEEDLAKKIRHMQKVIERVIPEFAKLEVKSAIKYSEEFYTEGIDDKMIEELEQLPIRFVGTSAPIKADNSDNYQYLPRTLKSLENINY